MNIRMVAKLAKVSTATVSRTMNGSAHVNPRTAERVREAIEALNFYPNTNARSLGSGRSGLFGLIVSDITNPFFPGLVKAFEDFALENGQEVLIANTNYDPKRMNACVTRFLQRNVEGVAIMTSEMGQQALTGLSRRPIPLVFLDSEHKGPNVRCVKIDYASGMEMVSDHLLNLGHRDIGFITGPLHLRSAMLRYKAFLKLSERRQLVMRPAMIQEGNHRVDGGHAAMLRLLESGEKPTAMLTSNDLTAIGAISAIKEFGMRVPEDISVVGFDDIPFSAYTSPPLTTVAVPGVEIARAAFKALMQIREGADTLGTVRRVAQTIHPSMVVRSSTAPPRKAPAARNPRRRAPIPTSNA
jgi:DNA-binding LacI/PurR family transcriptional regulator